MLMIFHDLSRFLEESPKIARPNSAADVRLHHGGGPDAWVHDPRAGRAAEAEDGPLEGLELPRAPADAPRAAVRLKHFRY